MRHLALLLLMCSTAGADLWSIRHTAPDTVVSTRLGDLSITDQKWEFKALDGSVKLTYRATMDLSLKKKGWVEVPFFLLLLGSEEDMPSGVVYLKRSVVLSAREGSLVQVTAELTPIKTFRDAARYDSIALEIHPPEYLQPAK